MTHPPPPQSTTAKPFKAPNATFSVCPFLYGKRCVGSVLVGGETAAFGGKQPPNPQHDPCQSEEQIPAPEPSVGLAPKRFCQLGSKPGTAQRAAPGPPSTAPRSDGERQLLCTHRVPSLGFVFVLDYNLAAAQATAARGTSGGAGCCSSICSTAASSSSLPWVWAQNCLFWGSTRGGGCSTLSHFIAWTWANPCQQDFGAGSSPSAFNFLSQSQPNHPRAMLVLQRSRPPARPHGAAALVSVGSVPACVGQPEPRFPPKKASSWSTWPGLWLVPNAVLGPEGK